MGIVDLLSIPRLERPAAVARRQGRALHARRRRLEEPAGAISHIWRAPVDGGAAGAAHQRRRRRERAALVARRQDDRLHRQARRQRVRPDLPAAGRRRRSASADDARQRRVGASRGRPTAPPIYFKAAEPKTADEKAREKARDDVYAYDENYKQTHIWKVTVASKAETRDHRRRLLGHRLRAVGRRPQDDVPPRADAAARRRRPQRGLGGQRRRHRTPCR